MLYTRLRESPCNAFALRVSASRTSDTRLSCTLALISRGSVHCNFPLGPSTDTCPPLPTFTLTFSGISTAFFPIRDMRCVFDKSLQCKIATRRRPAVRRRSFAFLLRVLIEYLAKWKGLPGPFRQGPAGFHRPQHNDAIRDD